MRTGMGTFIAISAQASTPHRALSAIEAAFAAIEHVGTLMHPTRRGSDLAAIRQGGLNMPLPVHLWTWEVLALSRRLNELSKGSFDPCLPSAPGRLVDLEFAPPQSVIAHKPLHIDLGGIAKGYAVDVALQVLRAAGCHGGLVNAGGDLAAFGDRSYPVVVAEQGVARSVVEINNAALATTAVCSSVRPAEHRGYYDGANRREICTGSVTICAPCAAIADGLTKCLLADPGETSSALLATFGARVIAYRDPN